MHALRAFDILKSNDCSLMLVIIIIILMPNDLYRMQEFFEIRDFLFRKFFVTPELHDARVREVQVKQFRTVGATVMYTPLMMYMICVNVLKRLKGRGKHRIFLPPVKSQVLEGGVSY